MTTQELLILLVEDSAPCRSSQRRYLNKFFPHCRILETSLGREGLSICREEPVDCVLLDFQLPDMDGLAFLTTLRLQLKKAFLPVIMITAHGCEQVAVKAMKHGAQDYLVKGVFNGEILAHAVRMGVERTQFQKAHLEKQKETAQAYELLKTETALRFKLESEQELLSLADPPETPLASMDEASVLVVDDHLEDRDFYRNKLEAHSQPAFHLTFARTGEEGMALCRQMRPDCVVLEYRLPDMTGLEFIKGLLEREKRIGTPVVMATAHGSEAIAAQAMETGAQNYLCKSKMTGESLRRAIGEAMKKVALIRQVARQRRDLESANRELVREVSERKKAEGKLQLFRNVISQTDDSLLIIDYQTGKLLDFNDTSCENLGYSRERMAKMSIFDVDGKLGGQAAFRRLAREVKREGHRLAEGMHLRGDGGGFPVEINFKHARMDNREYIVAVARDITQRKNREMRLVEQTIHDSLTGVYNRRYLDRTLKLEWRRNLRDQRTLSMIMLDIDHFKLFNDTYGHPAGDMCLKRAAQIIHKRMRRPADFVARYGGEEFAVVLPNTDLSNAVTIAERLRADIEGLAIPHTRSLTSSYVTASLGVASVAPSLNGIPDELVALADQALYQSKESGRNKVTRAA